MQLKADVLEVERDAATGVTVEIASVATAVPAAHHHPGRRRACARRRSFRSLRGWKRSTPTPASTTATPSSRWSGTCSRTPGKSAPRSTSATRSTCSSRSRSQAVAEAGLGLRDIDIDRHQHDHRARDPEPRGAPDEPPRLPPRRGAAADLRARLRRRRRRSCARDAHGAGAARAPTCCSSPSTCARCACAPTTRASPCSSPPRCSATARRASCCAATPARPRRAHGAARARIGAIGEYFWSKTEHIMGWDIKNDGFGVVLSPELPTLMRERLGEALFPFLARDGPDARRTSTASCCIPAAARCSTTAEEALQLSRDQLALLLGGAAQLRQHVVGDGAVRASRRRSATARAAAICSAAFGPGFSAYFIVLELY